MVARWTQKGGEFWGPWVLHDGKGCPVPVGTIVEVVSEDRFGFAMRSISTVSGGSYSSWNWEHYPKLKRIIRYREKKPKGLQILEQNLVVKDVPAPPNKQVPAR